MSNRKRRNGARFKELQRRAFTRPDSHLFLTEEERQLPGDWTPPKTLSEQLHERCTRREQRT